VLCFDVISDIFNVGFEVLTVVVMKIIFSWDITFHMWCWNCRKQGVVLRPLRLRRKEEVQGVWSSSSVT
jgi:hypothetical protein